jgi:hypothetical protein
MFCTSLLRRYVIQRVTLWASALDSSRHPISLNHRSGREHCLHVWANQREEVLVLMHTRWRRPDRLQSLYVFLYFTSTVQHWRMWSIRTESPEVLKCPPIPNDVLIHRSILFHPVCRDSKIVGRLGGRYRRGSIGGGNPDGRKLPPLHDG